MVTARASGHVLEHRSLYSINACVISDLGSLYHCCAGRMCVSGTRAGGDEVTTAIFVFHACCKSQPSVHAHTSLPKQLLLANALN